MCVLLDFVSPGMRWISKPHLEMFSLCYRGFKYTVTSPDIAHLALLCPSNKPDLEKVYISLIFSRLKCLVHPELLPISIELAEDSTESRLLQGMQLGEREHSQSSCPTDSQLLKQSFELIDSWLLHFILQITLYPHVTRLRSTKSTLEPLFHLHFGFEWDWSSAEKVPRSAFFHLPWFWKKNRGKTWKITSRRTYKQNLHAVKAFYCSLEVLYMTAIHSHILAFIYHINHIFFDLNILIPPEEVHSLTLTRIHKFCIVILMHQISLELNQRGQKKNSSSILHFSLHFCPTLTGWITGWSKTVFQGTKCCYTSRDGQNARKHFPLWCHLGVELKSLCATDK